MRKLAAAAVFLCALAAPAAGLGAEAAEVSVSDLLADPEEWNLQQVAITGELVGDYSRRPDGIWVQLNDDAFASASVDAGGAPEGTNTGIGARISPEVFSGGVEGPPGRYGRRGPFVRLEGVFRHADPDLNGETYVEVETATTLIPARNLPVPGPDIWLVVGVGLMAAAGGITWLLRRRQETAD